MTYEFNRQNAYGDDDRNLCATARPCAFPPGGLLSFHDGPSWRRPCRFERGKKDIRRRKVRELSPGEGPGHGEDHPGRAREERPRTLVLGKQVQARLSRRVAEGPPPHKAHEVLLPYGKKPRGPSEARPG